MNNPPFAAGLIPEEMADIFGTPPNAASIRQRTKQEQETLGGEGRIPKLTPDLCGLITF